MLKYTIYNIYTLLNILVKQFNTLSPMFVVFVWMVSLVGLVGQALFDMQLNSVERNDKPSKHYQIKTFHSFCTYYDSTIRLVY